MDNALNPVTEEDEDEKVAIEDEEDVEKIKVAPDPKLPPSKRLTSIDVPMCHTAIGANGVL